MFRVKALIPPIHAAWDSGFLSAVSYSMYRVKAPIHAAWDSVSLSAVSYSMYRVKAPNHTAWDSMFLSAVSCSVYRVKAPIPSIHTAWDSVSLSAVSCSVYRVKAPIPPNHAAWDSGFLESVDHRLQLLERTLSQYAGRFICDPSSTAQESIAGGLANITDKSERSIHKEGSLQGRSHLAFYAFWHSHPYILVHF